MQPARDHQVNHQPEVAIDAYRDALADAPHFAHGPAFHFADRGLCRAQQKGACHTHLQKWLAGDARLKGADVCGDVGQFRHEYQIACHWAILQCPCDLLLRTSLISVHRRTWLTAIAPTAKNLL